MLIGGLQKTTLIDYPGKVACTVFLAGCNFRCPWCYAPHLVLPQEIKKLAEERISQKEFFSFLKKRRGLLEGVVVCGGEPCQNKELPEFIKKIKKLGYSVKLDTNGSNPAMLKKLIERKLIDYIAMDIKAGFQVAKYKKAAGVKVDLNKIKKSIEIIKSSGVAYEFRMTVVPGIHQKKDIIQAAREISPAKKLYLQNFRPEKTIDSEFKKIKPYSKEFLLEIQKEISPFFDICQTR